jgi:hypothetical protein
LNAVLFISHINRRIARLFLFLIKTKIRENWTTKIPMTIMSIIALVLKTKFLNNALNITILITSSMTKIQNLKWFEGA